MKRFYLQYRRYFFFSLLLVLAFLVWAIYQAQQVVPTIDEENFGQQLVSREELAPFSKTEPEPSLTRTFKALSSKKQDMFIQVDVKGEVKQPGIYQIAQTANLSDLLDLAGGLTADAASDYLNLAMPLTDQQLYRIPSVSEINSLHLNNKLSCLKPGVLNVLPDEYIQSLNLKQAHGTSSEQAGKATTLVNINCCEQAELAKVPHVGQNLAARIIAYRNEHGSFSSLQALLRVKGIKSKKLKQIKVYLTCSRSIN